MANDVDVTTAVWGTTSLKKVTGEIYDQTAQNQIADNTGVCFYAPQTLSITEDTLSTASPTVSHSNYGYVGAGTYQAYGIMYYSAVDYGTADITVGGTSIMNIVTGASGGTALTANAEIIQSADGWATTTYTLDIGSASGTVSMTKGGVAIRRKG